MLKKNRLEKLVSPVKRSAWLYDINEVSIVFSWEIDIKTGESIWKGLISKAL